MRGYKFLLDRDVHRAEDYFPRKRVFTAEEAGLKAAEWAGLSQEAFAARCGLAHTYVSGIERGKGNVARRNIEAIALALD